MTSFTEAFIVYFLGILVVPNLRDGRARRALEKLYWPFVHLGLWHRWSMYSPDVPGGTRIALAAVIDAEGRAEVVPIPGFDDDRGFGKAFGLRFVSFQYALSDPSTDYVKSALCEYALARWREGRVANAVDRPPVAVELHEYWYPSPPPGRREADAPPSARTIWRVELEEGA